MSPTETRPERDANTASDPTSSRWGRLAGAVSLVGVAALMEPMADPALIRDGHAYVGAAVAAWRGASPYDLEILDALQRGPVTMPYLGHPLLAEALAPLLGPLGMDLGAVAWWGAMGLAGILAVILARRGPPGDAREGVGLPGLVLLGIILGAGTYVGQMSPLMAVLAIVGLRGGAGGMLAVACLLKPTFAPALGALWALRARGWGVFLRGGAALALLAAFLLVGRWLAPDWITAQVARAESWIGTTPAVAANPTVVLYALPGPLRLAIQAGGFAALVGLAHRTRREGLLFLSVLLVWGFWYDLLLVAWIAILGPDLPGPRTADASRDPG